MTGWLEMEDDVCVVTGALGGMGAEICRELARNGARIALVDLDGAAARTAAAELSAQHGIDARGFAADITDEAAVDDLVKQVLDGFGRVDVLVNTAGLLRFAPMEDLPLSDWRAVLDLNLTGIFLVSQRFGRVMISQRSGRMVHISTVASRTPETYSGVYSSTKAALNMMSKMLAVEWGPFGIRSNTVNPCFVKTPMSQDFYSDPAVESGRSRLIATRRIGEVTDIANAVAFLASPRSDFTTGSEITVDGGFSLMMGDLTPKPGGRREYAEKHLHDRGFPLWSESDLPSRPDGSVAASSEPAAPAPRSTSEGDPS